MASKHLLPLLALLLLSTLSLHAHAAAPSAEEIALRTAITSGSAASYSLTKDIILTQDLPPLADSKILTVRSANIPGAPFKIAGQSKFLIFRSEMNAVVTLTLSSIILTRSPLAVDLGPDYNNDAVSKLTVNKVQFINNDLGIQLDHTKTLIDNSIFSGHTKSAISNIDTVDDGQDELKILKSTFFNNSVAKDAGGGGAIQLRRYTSTIIERSKFFGNSAEYNGGAVWLRGDDAGAKITLCEFANNKAGELGGAISVFESALDVLSSTFKNNVANLGGGAIRDEGYGTSYKLTKFTGNKAVQPAGGAIYFASYFDTTFCGCTFSGNTAGGQPNNIFVPTNDFGGVDGEIFTNPPVNIPLLIAEGDFSPFTNKTGTCP